MIIYKKNISANFEYILFLLFKRLNDPQRKRTPVDNKSLERKMKTRQRIKWNIIMLSVQVWIPL